MNSDRGDSITADMAGHPSTRKQSGQIHVEERCSPGGHAMGVIGWLKNEFFHHRNRSSISIQEFCRTLDTYLRFHNRERPKKRLGWMNQMQHRESLGLTA